MAIPKLSDWAAQNGIPTESTEEQLSALDRYTDYAKSEALKEGETDPEFYQGIDYGQFSMRARLIDGDAADVSSEAFTTFLSDKRTAPESSADTLEADDYSALIDKLAKAGREQDAVTVRRFADLKAEGKDVVGTDMVTGLRMRTDKLAREFSLDDIRKHGLASGLFNAAAIEGKLVTNASIGSPDQAKASIGLIEGPGITSDLKADFIGRFHNDAKLGGRNANQHYMESYGDFTSRLDGYSAEYVSKLRKAAQDDKPVADEDQTLATFADPSTLERFKQDVDGVGKVHYYRVKGKLRFGDIGIDTAIDQMGLDDQQALDFVTDLMRSDFSETDPEEVSARVLTTGELALHPAAFLNDKLFEKAMQVPASEGARRFVKENRDAFIDDKGIIAQASLVDFGFTDELEKARTEGKTDKQFIREYFNDPDNHSSLAAYSEALGAGVRDATWGLALGVLALGGNEWSRDKLVEYEKRRMADSSIRDYFGKGGTFSRLATAGLHTAPAVIMDIALVFAAGAGVETAAARVGVKGLIKGVLRESLAAETKSVVGRMLTRRATSLAAKEGAELTASNGVKLLTRDIHRAFNLGSVGTLAGTRVAGANYATVYSALVDQGLSPEDARTRALTTAAISGVKTAMLTSAFSFMGRGGAEAILDPARGITFKQLRKQAGQLFEGLSDDAARAALGQVMRKNLMGALKATGRDGLHEGVEEAIDEGIDYFVTTIGSKRDINLGHAAQQAFDAFILGGLMGGTITPTINAARTGDLGDTQAMAAQDKLLTDTISRLRASGNEETAAVLEEALSQAPVEGPAAPEDLNDLSRLVPDETDGGAPVDAAASPDNSGAPLPTPAAETVPNTDLSNEDLRQAFMAETGFTDDDFADSSDVDTLFSAWKQQRGLVPAAPAVNLSEADAPLANPTGSYTPPVTRLPQPAPSIPAERPRTEFPNQGTDLSQVYGGPLQLPEALTQPAQTNATTQTPDVEAPVESQPVAEPAASAPAPVDAGDVGPSVPDAGQGGVLPVEDATAPVDEAARIEQELTTRVTKLEGMARPNVTAGRKAVRELAALGFDTTAADAALAEYEGAGKSGKRAAWGKFVDAVTTLESPLVGVDTASFADVAARGLAALKETTAPAVASNPQPVEESLDENIPDPEPEGEQEIEVPEPLDQFPTPPQGGVVSVPLSEITYPEWEGNDFETFEKLVRQGRLLKQSQLLGMLDGKGHPYAKAAELALRQRIGIANPFIEHPGAKTMKGVGNVGTGNAKRKYAFPIHSTEVGTVALFTNDPVDAAEALNLGIRTIVPDEWVEQDLVNPNFTVEKLGKQWVVAEVAHPLGVDISRPGQLSSFLEATREKKVKKLQDEIAEARHDSVTFTGLLPKAVDEDKRFTKWMEGFEALRSDKGGMLAMSANRQMAEEATPIAYLRHSRETALGNELAAIVPEARLDHLKLRLSQGQKRAVPTQVDAVRVNEFVKALVKRRGYGEFRRPNLTGPAKTKNKNAALQAYIDNLVASKAGRPDPDAKQMVSYVNRKVNDAMKTTTRTSTSYDAMTEEGLAVGDEANVGGIPDAVRYAEQRLDIPDDQAYEALLDIYASLDPRAKQAIEAGLIEGVDIDQLAVAVARTIMKRKADADDSEVGGLERAVDTFLGTSVGRRIFTDLEPQLQNRILNTRSEASYEDMVARYEANRAEERKYGIESGRGGITKALSNIAAKEGGHLAEIARVLLPHAEAIEDATRLLVVDDVDSDYAGQTVGGARANLVMLNRAGSNGRGFADAFLHEVLHSHTEYRLRNPETAADIAAIEEISKLRRQFRDFVKKSGLLNRYRRYVTGSNSEFITGLLTDRTIQTEVAMMENVGGIRGLLQKLGNLIHRIFTGRDMKSPALTKVLSFTEGSSPRPYWNPGEVRVLNSLEFDPYEDMFGEAWGENTLFSDTDSMDAEYAEAIEFGDMRRARELVDDWASQNGFTHVMKHGTPDAQFRVMQFSAETPMIFGTSDRKIAETYARDTILNARTLPSMTGKKARYLTEDFAPIKTPADLRAELKGHPELSDFSLTKMGKDYMLRVTRVLPDEDSYETLTDDDGEIGVEFGLRTQDHEFGPAPFSDVLRGYLQEIGRPRVIEGFARMTNPVEVFANGKPHNALPNPFYDANDPESSPTTDTNELATMAKARGFDGIVIHDVQDSNSVDLESGTTVSTIVAVVDSKQFKSAAIAHYTEDGTLIPLSQRFQIDDPRISNASVAQQGPGQEASESLLRKAVAALPRSVRLIADPSLPTTMQARSDGTVRVNPAQLAAVTEGMAPASADALIRKIANEELAHLAGFSALTSDEVTAMANDLSDEDALAIADEYVSGTVFENDDSRVARIDTLLKDKAALVEERLRMTLQRATTGTTTEEDFAFYQSNPSFLQQAARYLRAALAKLVQRFKLRRDVAMASRIDRMRESMERLRNGGSMPVLQLEVGGPSQVAGDSRKLVALISDAVTKPVESRALHASVGVAVPFNSRSRLRQLFSAAGKNVVEFQKFEEEMEQARVAAEKQAERFAHNLDSTMKELYGKDRSSWPIDNVMKAFGNTDAALTKAQVDTLDASLKALRKTAYDNHKRVLSAVRRLWKQGKVKQADAALKSGRAVYKADLAAAAQTVEAQRVALVQANATQRKADRNAALAALPTQLQDLITPFREGIDRLSRELAVMPNGVSSKLAVTLDRNLEIYLKRSYALFDDPAYRDLVKADPEFANLRDRATVFFRDELVKAKAEELARTNPGVPLSTRLTMAQALVTPEEARKAMFDFVNSYEQDGGSAYYGGRLLDKKNISSLSQKKDIPEVLRELMGDYTLGKTKDLTKNAVRTYVNLANMVSAQHYQNKLGAVAVSNKWMATPADVQKDPENYFNYKLVEESKVKDLKLRPFVGHYIHPDLYEVLDHVDPLRHPTVKLGFMLTGLSMKAKTVWSFATTWRNHLGNVAVFGPAQGIPPTHSLFSGSQKKAFRLALRNAGWGRSTATDNALLEKLHRLGVIDDNAQLGYMRDLLKKTPEQITRAIGARNAKWKQVAGGMLGKAADGFKVVDKSLEELYQGIDNLHKIAVFDYELGVLQKANAIELDPAKRKTIEQLEQEAADKVRATQQSYSQTPEIVQFIRTNPVLGLTFAPFISFTSEVFRITTNTFKVGMQEIKSGNRVLRNRGLARIGAFIGMNATLSFLLPVLVKSLSGLGDDEEFAVRQALPEWMRTENLILRKNDDGTVTTFNVSNLNPFSILGDVAVAFPLALEDPRNGLDVSTALRVTYNGLKPMLDPFTNEQILSGAIIDASRGVDTATGRNIWLEGDSPDQKMAKGLMHIVKATLPGSVDSIRRLKQGADGYVTSTGKRVEFADELASMLSGVKQHDQDLPTLYSSFVSRYNREVRDAATMRYDITRRSSTDPADVTTAYDRYHDRMVELSKTHHKVLVGLQLLGVSKKDLIGVANEQRLSKDELNLLLSGRYERYAPEQSAINDLRIRANRADKDPTARVRALQEAIRSKPRFTPLYD